MPTVLGHYRIEDRLGAGGMGEVYRARDTQLDRTVAIKILPAEFAGDDDRMRRFVDEAKAASALSHPNVAHIYEIGDSDDVRFIAMEYVDGQRLDARIASRPMEVAAITDLAVQIADALDEAHTKGVIHRDLKPANIMITPRGQVKVLDFGLAKIRKSPGPTAGHDRSTAASTQTGVVMGTVQYMSPEQALGRAVDHRTDVFSFGLLLYEMVTGRVPFQGASTTETIEQIAHAAPEAIARFNYAAPEECERIVRKCLEKDAARRYQSSRELLIDLKNLKRDSDSGVATVRPLPRSGRGAWFAAAGGAVVIGLLAWAAVRWGPGGGAAQVLDSVVVLPFVNTRNDPGIEYLADGIAEGLVNELSQLPGVRVVPRGVAFRYKNRDVDPQAIGRELGVRAVLSGRFEQRGEALNIQVDLVDAE